MITCCLLYSLPAVFLHPLFAVARRNFRASAHHSESHLNRELDAVQAHVSSKWQQLQDLPLYRSQAPSSGTPGFDSLSVSDVMAGGRRISAPDEARGEAARLNAAGRAPNLLMRNGKRCGLHRAIR